ncbi:N-acetylneuraminate synthase family protein [Motilibacter deserti]|uniref:N-acetylneuraminate synthase n=1 Tax=Motilibacter deserti TaxID=2714956 RepID=A0ABX0GXV1_9ACTN|nr:N-acetylneuraminate synthase family protein [Motilibacter deserti]NHC14604.1 N-acetylneuraminate synthase [Motilibacter deserti]
MTGPYVIAEAGVNHDGDLGVAHELIDVAVAAGADAVKFQTFDPDALVAAGADVTPYQRRSGVTTGQRDMLAALALPATAWSELAKHAEQVGISFLSSPFDAASARLLVDLGVGMLKVGSGELTNLPFLAELATAGLPLLLSTGMATEDEVADALAAVGTAVPVSLLHCVSAYPAPFEDANLRVIPRMQERFGVPVGWSDHTEGTVTAVAAVALGASLLEKHITTDRTRTGPDHAASMEPAVFTQYVADVRAAAGSLGDGQKRRMPSEQANAPLVRRSWHAAVDLAPGAVLSASDVVALRPETGIPPTMSLVGRQVARPVPAGQPVRPEDLA